MSRYIEGSADGITILDSDGKLLPVVHEILDIIDKYQMVLATGHLSVEEIFTLVDEARSKGLSKILITHPLGAMRVPYFSLDEQCRVAEKGAFLEYCFNGVIEGWFEPVSIVETVKAVGAAHCILSTDFGQDHNPAPTEGMRVAIAYMLRYGLTENEVELMVKVNPAKLLGLD